MAVTQWVRRWSSDHRAVQVEDASEGSSPGGETFFSAMIFISVLLGLMVFSDIVMLRSGLANKTLSVLICLYYR